MKQWKLHFHAFAIPLFVIYKTKNYCVMSEDLLGSLIKESWSDYPKIFRPKFFKMLLFLVIIICFAAVCISFLGIPKDAETTTPGLENVPVPVAISGIILFVLPLPCLVVGLLLGLIPISTVPYKVKFMIAAVIHG
jgi:hypothetical protein